MLGGRLDWRDYLKSLRGFHVESVFSREDPLPGLVELALIPYLCAKRGF
jgi:predicted ATP-grasp superfamily ATP-dependent carboligase